VYLMCRDQYYIEYTAKKDKPDFVTHAFHWHWYWDNLMKSQLTEFNNAYRGINLQRVKVHVTLTLKDFQIKDKNSSSIDNYFPRSPDFMYLWHYSYETPSDVSVTCCDTDYIVLPVEGTTLRGAVFKML
jgi:hypothetical protein